MASVSDRLTGGLGVSLLSAVGTSDLPELGFVEEEYLVEGRAHRFDPVGELGADGRWEVREAGEAAFATRIVVRRPASAHRANGTVVVEWLNVSPGADGAPDWTYLSREIVRGGYCWVGVSAQAVGVEGGTGLVAVPDVPDAVVGGLVGTDPPRYGRLHHPGDAFALDLFAQVGECLRTPGPLDPLGGLPADRVLAVGESQSAFFLTAYANAIQPRVGAYDAILIHSRGAGAARLDGTAINPDSVIAVQVRDDLDVPVMIVETETDLGPVLRYFDARQPDHERLRVWEIAGTAHADDFQTGGFAELFGFAHPVNRGPQHLVMKAALRHLDTWVRDGSPPPVAPRLTAVAGPRLVRDGYGNALGGIRTPIVDVPVAEVTGDNDATTRFELLFGRTVPFDADTLRALYPSRKAYLEAYRQSAADVVAAGFVLVEDETDLLAMADPSGIPD
jgi:Alpha/beta hydrolase domain